MTKRPPRAVLAALPIVSAMAVAQPRALELAAYRAPSVPQLVEDGTAVVAFTVRADGRIRDAVTLYATRRELADAAQEAVSRWRVALPEEALGPGGAPLHGPNAVPSAVLRREIVEFVFKRDGVVSSMTHLDAEKSWFGPTHEPAVRTVVPEDLGIDPVRTSATPTARAAALVLKLKRNGKATVSYVIDESGNVRVPFIVAADDPSLGEAALALVESWRYEPPTRDGLPILVEERKTFTFRPEPN